LRSFGSNASDQTGVDDTQHGVGRKKQVDPRTSACNRKALRIDRLSEPANRS
jgi:hypothetical protein